MGNPSWGKGYHTGYADGAKTGGLIGVGITLVITGLTAAAHWGYKKIKLSQAKKREREMLAEESLLMDDDNKSEEEKHLVD